MKYLMCTARRLDPTKSSIQSYSSPTNNPKVVYGTDDAVELGNGLTPPQCALPPTVSWEAHPDKYYTLIMLDLDAVFPELLPLPHTILHWGRYNIKGGDMSTGTDFAPYLPVTPPPTSDVHRYVQLVYEQPCPLKLGLGEFLKTTAERLSFKNEEYVAKHKLGNAKFGNYFLGKFLFV
ncbi:phosphatidylethanolamine-binding protein domain-containing protein [Phthorimaea operculella]|nr:phosphatidylethanolamine-binding protein domain-containing protein [Phthorimaea operculella]